MAHQTGRRSRLKRYAVLVAVAVLVALYVPHESREKAEQSAFRARVAGKWAPDELTSSSSASVPYNVDERSRDGLQIDGGSTQHHLITEEEGESTREAGTPPPPPVKLPFTTNAPLTGVWKDLEKHREVTNDIVSAFTAGYAQFTSTLVMATVANEAFHELLLNWIAFAARHNIPIMVGALDDETLRVCKQAGVPAVSLQHIGMETSLISLDEKEVENKNFRGSRQGFQTYGVRKLALLLTLLEMGLDVSLSDTDVVWTKSPAELFSREGNSYSQVADVLVSSDCLSQEIDEAMSKAAALTLTSEGEPIFNYREWACGVGGAAPWEDNASPLTSRMNTGVTFFRSTAGGISMAKRWIESLEMCFDSDVRGCDDQFSFNRGAEHTRSPIMDDLYGTKPVSGGEGRVFWSDLGEARCKLGLLPISDFSNGHVYFLQKVSQNLERQPYAVHNTHNYFGAQGKLYRFRSSHMWAPDEGAATYSAQLKFLSFDSLASDAASKQTSPLVSHIVSRDELRRELWAAAGVAKALGRILVLPRFNCYCDRYWYPILPQCRMPGSQRFKSSQSCPLDQILNVGVLADKEFIVDTRVDGFLEHPDAASLLQSQRVVQPLVEASGKASCMTPSQLSKLFATPETVLHVAGGIKGLFCGFPDDSVESKALDTSISKAFDHDWCCHENGTMPITRHPSVKASAAGSADAGPRADEETIRRAREVWRLTNPDKDKWQGRIFGVHFPEGSEMAQHNHYTCS